MLCKLGTDVETALFVSYINNQQTTLLQGSSVFLEQSYDAYTDGLVQECSNSRALAMELLQSSATPSIYQSYEIILRIFKQ